MKKKLFALLGIFTTIIIGSVAVSKLANRNDIVIQDEETLIVTSFYPMYILTANLAKDVPGVSVVNLTENQTGCLHDYQLVTKDMIKLNSADLLVMNGGGMESFLENVVASYPDLKVVEASEGITMLPSESEHNHDHGTGSTSVIEEGDVISEEEQVTDPDHTHGEESEATDPDHTHEEESEVTDPDHTHEEESEATDPDHTHEEESEVTDPDHTHEEDSDEEDHDHGEYNAHVWMNMNDYLIQMQNVYQALVENDPENKAIYDLNYESYKGKVEEIKAEYERELTNFVNHDVVIFHDAFAYMAQEIGLDVIYTINLDGETYLSAGEVKDIIDEVNGHGVKVLFTEEQYSDSIAESVAKETEAKVYVIDSLVTGDLDLDSYLNGMRNNLEVLKEALY